MGLLGAHLSIAGGLYKASANGREVVFKVDENAAPTGGPLIGRMLKLGPA